MSAYPDDLRYFYSAVIGRSTTIAATDAASVKVAEALSPGRYLLSFLDLSAGGRLWVRQGPLADVVATLAAPSFPLDADSVRAIEFTVRPGPTTTVGAGTPESNWDGIAALMTAGATATVVITKISRDLR